MNYFKISTIVFATSLLVGSASAQQVQNVEKENNTGENLKTVEVNTQQVATVKKESLDEKLTPEQQGFTKYILGSGKIIYRKIENNIIIEFIPENE